MICICKPYPGYHRPECPCQAAYERLKAKRAAVTPEEHEIAREYGYRLAREGWHQASLKYRAVTPSRGYGQNFLELDELTFAYFREARAMTNNLCADAADETACAGRGVTRILDPARK